jgi:acetyl esterase
MEKAMDSKSGALQVTGVRLLAGVLAMAAAAVAEPARDGRRTSENDERLRQLLKRAPRADANRDGVLTMAEAQAWRRKAQARRPGRTAARRSQPKVPPPDVKDFSYGKAARQAFDLWLAKSDRPTPLVLYIHGGGFRGGDKRSVSRRLLDRCLKAGISYASINYRLTDEVAYPHTHRDAARALQTLRHNAKKWNLDPKRVASTGGSAGAGISMWLAFHDDLAEPKSADPVARQSTRLTCIAVNGGQCSYDHRFNASIGLPGFERHPFFLPFYGIKPEEIDSPRQKRLAKDAAAITHLTKDDAPALLDYNVPNEPVTEKTLMGAIVHHPTFGVVLKKKMDPLGIECIVQWPGHPKTGRISAFDFIRKHFGRTGKGTTTE